MLPSILDVAEKFNLESDPRTYGKKESLFKCPFCKHDSLPKNKHKYYLSLNTVDNVFKCWYCSKSGGVLHFESLLANKPFKEIRKKYFGEKEHDTHPAYNLSPDQLKAIGWYQVKRKQFNEFKKKKDDVLKAWKMYEYNELTKHYALMTLIAHFPIKKERKDYYEWFIDLCNQSIVDHLSQRIVQQWNAPKKEQWAIEGHEIAQIAYAVTYDSGDFVFENLFVNILFVQYIMKNKKKNDQKNYQFKNNHLPRVEGKTR